MGLIKKLKSLGKNNLIGLAILVSCSLAGCEQKTEVTAPDEIIIDPKHTGMIAGRVLSSRIENNQVVYVPYEQPWDDIDVGAYVWLIEENPPINAKFETVTTPEGGAYSIDNIPAGTYTIEALRQKGDRLYGGYSEVPKDRKPVTVIKQETVVVPDLELFVQPVLKGKIYEEDKITPFANESVSLYGTGQFMHSTVTSSDGSYAFERSKKGLGQKTHFTLKTSGGKLFFFDTNEEESGYVRFRYDIVTKHLYFVPTN